MDKKEKLNYISARQDATVKEVMGKIEKAGSKIAFVVDENKKLVGVVSDGDMRRALLAGENLNIMVEKIMTKNPIMAQEDALATELLEKMLDKSIQEIPLVNKEGVLVNFITLSELKSIPLSSPDITHKEVEIISQVLSTPYLSIGPRIKEFEKKVADYVGVKYAVAVNSGTSGLHLCIRSLDIKDGDEVITTPFSFIASANCILFERAKPVFVDIDEDNLCIDVNKIEEKITNKTKAILPVHVFGHPCEMDKIMGIAQKYNLTVIEDACEALGSEYNNKKAGSFGNVAVFAFYPNKQITTGEGGIIVTDDEKIAKLCQSMRNQGRDEGDSWLSHPRLGYNYRMTEVSAALGATQMGRIKEILEKRKGVAKIYNRKLADIEGIKIPFIGKGVEMSWFVYVVILDKRFSRKDRDKIIQKLNEKSISARDYFPPIHLEPFYVEKFGYKKGDFPITEKVSESTIALPFYNNLTESEINYIGDSLKEILKGFNG